MWIRVAVCSAVLSLMLAVSGAAAPAGCLYVNANPGSVYGDRTINSIVWGDGYPTVNVFFQTDTNIVYPPEHGGGQKQRFANNGLAPGSLNNDNPAFISIYTNTLRLNAMIADTGTVSTLYTFSEPMTLIDVIVCDLDSRDVVTVTAFDSNNVAMPASIFEVMGEGDLSLTNNAGGRPPLELATPPVWDAVSGVLTASVPWNENRTFTILRVPEGTSVGAIKLEFHGFETDTDGPGGSRLGSHIYAALWASPRSDAIATLDSTNGAPVLTLPTLPGLLYEISSSSDLDVWNPLAVLTGQASPVTHAVWTHVGGGDPAEGIEFYRYRRSAP